MIAVLVVVRKAEKGVREKGEKTAIGVRREVETRRGEKGKEV